MERSFGSAFAIIYVSLIAMVLLHQLYTFVINSDKRKKMIQELSIFGFGMLVLVVISIPTVILMDYDYTGVFDTEAIVISIIYGVCILVSLYYKQKKD